MLGTALPARSFAFDLEVRVGAGAYVCGEETSLLDSLEGKRGQVRAKPPLPAHHGLFGRPTVINNVLSFATRPHHHGQGRRASTAISAWAARAAPCRSSSPATSNMAACSRPRSASRSASSSTTSAAARLTGRPVRAVQVGGPLGAYFPRALFDTPFDYEAFAARDGLIGHGGIVVFDDTVDMAKQARFAMEFCAIESCGKCTPCRIGSTRGVEVDRPHHPGREPRRQYRGAGGPLQHHEVRIALRARRLHALSGDERAHPFPRRFRRASRRLQAAE